MLFNAGFSSECAMCQNFVLIHPTLNNEEPNKENPFPARTLFSERTTRQPTLLKRTPLEHKFLNFWINFLKKLDSKFYYVRVSKKHFSTCFILSKKIFFLENNQTFVRQKYLTFRYSLSIILLAAKVSAYTGFLQRKKKIHRSKIKSEIPLLKRAPLEHKFLIFPTFLKIIH